MKFSTTKDVLLKGIQSAQNVVNIKSNPPILSNILLETSNDNLVLTATDLDIGIISTIQVKPIIVGAVTIPARKLLDVIKELPEGETVSVSVKKNSLTHIECVKNEFKIMGLPKDEFPQLPEFKDKDHITIEQKKLKTMLRMTGFAVSSDETRYVLNGVLFVVRPDLVRMVATDGRRLAMVEEKMDLPKTLERKVIVPTKAVNELVRILSDDGEARILFGENQIFFDMGQTRLVSRLIEGDFPNYEQVIPKESKDRFVVEKARLLSAIKRAALFTTSDSIAVRFDLSRDKLVISKNTPYLGEARVEVDVDYKGKDLSTGFNPDYIVDVLKNIDQESIGFEIIDAEKPGVIRIASEYVYVVLPMQLT